MRRQGLSESCFDFMADVRKSEVESNKLIE